MWLPSLLCRAPVELELELSRLPCRCHTSDSDGPRRQRSKVVCLLERAFSWRASAYCSGRHATFAFSRRCTTQCNPQIPSMPTLSSSNEQIPRLRCTANVFSVDVPCWTPRPARTCWTQCQSVSSGRGRHACPAVGAVALIVISCFSLSGQATKHGHLHRVIRAGGFKPKVMGVQPHIRDPAHANKNWQAWAPWSCMAAPPPYCNSGTRPHSGSEHCDLDMHAHANGQQQGTQGTFR